MRKTIKVHHDSSIEVSVQEGEKLVTIIMGSDDPFSTRVYVEMSSLKATRLSKLLIAAAQEAEGNVRKSKL